MLPESPNRTYGTDTPVHPGDLNDIQDAIVGAKHGEKTLVIPGSDGKANSLITIAPQEHTITTTGAIGVSYGIQLAVGDRIKSVKVIVSGNASADITGIEVLRVPTTVGAVPPAVAVQLGNVVPAANTPNLITEISIDITDYTIAANNSLSVHVAVNATGIVIYRVEVVYDHP